MCHGLRNDTNMDKVFLFAKWARELYTANLNKLCPVPRLSGMSIDAEYLPLGSNERKQAFHMLGFFAEQLENLSTATNRDQSRLFVKEICTRAWLDSRGIL